MWDHTAVAADSKLIVSLVVGKRTHEQTQGLGARCQESSPSRASAGDLHRCLCGYESAILEASGVVIPNRATRKRSAISSLVRWPQGLAYGQVKKTTKGGIERVEVRAVYGKARLQHVLSLLGYKTINPTATL